MIDIAVATTIGICLLIAFFTLRETANNSGKNSFRYFAYAFGAYFLALAFPFLMLLLSLVFDSLLDDVGEDEFNLLATAPIIVGTVFLVIGTRKLRRETDVAK